MASSEEPPTKKSKTTSTNEDEGSKHDADNVKKVYEAINICQTEIEKLNEKASEEILQIEQKYNKLRKPFFRQRNEHFKRLPKFWGTAMNHHPHLSSIIQEEEKLCLNYINDCIAEEFDDIKLGYVISFHFDENPYIENSVITKTMHLASSANASSESTPIKWKDGKDLIKKYSAKIARRSKRQPPVTFFSWFLDNTNASGDEVAETIKEDLWPSALQYYLARVFEDKNGRAGLDQEDDSSDCEEYEEEGQDEDLGDSGEEEETDEQLMAHEVDSVAEAELEGNLEEDSQSYNESDEEGSEQADRDEAQEAEGETIKKKKGGSQEPTDEKQTEEKT